MTGASSPQRRQGLLLAAAVGTAWCLPTRAHAVRDGLPGVAAAQPRAVLDLSLFERGGGALITNVHAPDEVDPYFALKALWVGHRMGLDVSRSWPAWAAWMVDHQDPDGRWGRWRLEGAHARREREADADDALLALWLQCVAELGLPEALRARHKAGLRLAETYLHNRLFDARLGVFKVFAHDDAHLWMDNIEVWSAMLSLAQADLSWCEGLPSPGVWQGRADALARSMSRVFRAHGGAAPQVSTQHLPGPAQFYPHLVTGPFAWLHDWPGGGDASLRMAVWAARHEALWVEQARTDYPWGLLAVAAWRDGEVRLAERWLQRTRAQRGGLRWNILEEAAYQGLFASLEAVSAPLLAVSKLDEEQ